MRNRYEGTCYKCGCHVPVGFGFFERCGRYPSGKTIWRIQCVKCCDGRTVHKTDKEVIRAKNMAIIKEHTDGEET